MNDNTYIRVRLLLEQGQSVEKVAKDLGIGIEWVWLVYNELRGGNTSRVFY